MRKLFIHYYADTATEAHTHTKKQLRDLKATQEVFLQGWAHWIRSTLFRPFPSSILTRTNNTEKEAMEESLSSQLLQSDVSICVNSERRGGKYCNTVQKIWIQGRASRWVNAN